MGKNLKKLLEDMEKPKEEEEDEFAGKEVVFTLKPTKLQLAEFKALHDMAKEASILMKRMEARRNLLWMDIHEEEGATGMARFDDKKQIVEFYDDED